MKSVFPCLPVCTQTMLGSHLAHWNHRVAAICQDSLYLKLKAFNVILVYSDFQFQTSAGVIFFINVHANLESDLYTESFSLC